MCSPRLSDSSSEMTGKKFGIRLWYFIKILEYCLTAVCILLLVLNEYLTVVYDDFTPAYTQVKETPKNDLPDKQSQSAIYSALSKFHLDDRKLIRVKRGPDHHHSETKLSYLMILYSCCTTVIIFLTMELLAQALKDPLNKTSNIVLVVLSTLLSATIFAVSLICVINAVHVSTILVTILSAVLVLIMFIDFILLTLS